MDRDESINQLKFLYDQLHQTAERVEHLPERMPLHIHPRSLNYADDLLRIKGEYNRLAGKLMADGLITEDGLVAEGLPVHWERQK